MNEYSTRINAKMGAVVKQDLSSTNLPGMQLVQIPDSISVIDAIAEYEKSPDVLYAEPNYVYSISSLTPNDPYFSSHQWGLHNTGQTIEGSVGTVDADIDAPEAWDLSTGSNTVIVAVIDSGVDYNHPDLSANIWTNSDEIPSNGIDDDRNGYIDDVRGWNFYSKNNDPMDGNTDEGTYHGTHCSGIIGAVGNNGVGMSGVNWNVKIMPLRFMDASGMGYTSNGILAINYASANGASVISNSWAGSGYSQSLKDAIDSSPAVVVCAAGNDGTNNENTPQYPSDYTSANIISVAATDNQDNLVWWSNYGTTSVDLAAPGVNIYSTKKDSAYQYMSGTSMATPFVAGVAALVKAKDPSLTNIQIRSAILNNVDTKSSLSGKVVTGGRLNAYKAVNTVDANFVGTPTSGTAPLTVVFTDSSTNTPTSWSWNFGDSSSVNATQRNPVHTYANIGTYTVSLTAANSAGSNTFTRTNYITVAVIPVANFAGTPTSGTAPLTVKFTDSSTNTPTSWSWNFGDGSSSTLKNPFHTYTSVGSWTVALTATNPAGSNLLTRTNYITVSSGGVTPVANFAGTPTSGTASLTVTFTDLSTNMLTYSSAQNQQESEFGLLTKTIPAQGTSAAQNSITEKVVPIASATSDELQGAPLNPEFIRNVREKLYDSVNEISAEGGSNPSGNQDPRISHRLIEHQNYIQKKLNITVQNTSLADTVSTSGSETYNFVTKWGTEGEGDGQFSYPEGVAVDSSGNVYVAEAGNDRIQKFRSDGTFLTKWGSMGSGDGQFFWPGGIAVDSSDNIYVVEDIGSRIQKFSSNGVFLAKWGSYWQFCYPKDVTVDSSGNVYVADSGNSRIQKLSSTGSILMMWGTEGSGDGQFYHPEGVAVDSSGNVFIADTWNNRIQKFDSPGSFLAKWGSGGSGNGQFSDPLCVAVDLLGNVYVADVFNFRIQKFNSDGTFLTKWGSYGSDDGRFSSPKGVAVDSSGNVYVLESYRIQKFAPSSASWSWNFGDSSSVNATQRNPVHTYANIGTYTVKLTATNSAGGSNTFTRTNYITVTSAVVAPIANFTGTPTSGTAPLTVVFTDSSTNTPTSWSWNFGDSSSVNATVKNPVHTYASVGTYTVALTATNSAGSNALTRIGYIAVTSGVVTPVAAFTGTPTSGTAPLTVTFADSSTNSPTSWSWSFGDGSTSTLQNPSHAYSSVGTYTVALTATNSAGSNTLTRTNYITVASDVIPPTISITYPTDNQVFTMDTVTVSGTASDNVGLSKVEVKVGSQSWLTATGTTSWSKSVTLASGSNTITARATDKSGNTKDAVTVAYMTGVVAAPLITWQKSLGGTLEDSAYSVQQTSDGGYIVAGYSYSNNDDITGNHGENDYWIVKLDSTGAITWQKSLGGTSWDSANSIQQTLDGGYIVAGITYSNEGDVTGFHGHSDYWIVKLDSAGTIIWQKSLGGTSVDYAFSVQQTSDGGYIVAGSSSSNDGDVTGNHGNTDYWIVKLDSAGTITWEKSLGGTAYDSAYSVQQTSDGGYIVAGSSDSINGDVTGNHGIYQQNDYWIVKLNSAGAITWQKSLGGSLADYARSVQQTSDGGYIVAGESYSNDGDVTGNHGNGDYWIVKLDSAGAITWQKSLGGTNWEYTQSVQQTSDGGYIVAGWSMSNDGDVTDYYGSIDYWIVKLDSTGSISWQKSLGGALNDCGESVQQTSDGGYIVAGGSNSIDGDVTGNHGSLDYWIVKLGSSGVVTPVANFTGTPTSGTAPLTVTFTDSSTNTPTSWSWDFGDGSSVNSTMQNPVHTYTTAGNYTVALTAANSAGSDTMTRANYITVTEPPTSSSTVGIFRNGAFFLASSNINGGEPVNAFGYGQDGDIPIVGDWNKDGTTEVGIYRTDPYRGAFFLASSNTPGGGAVNAFTYGQDGDVPVAGDWNGDGTDTVGIFRNGVFFLASSNINGGEPVNAFTFGQAGDVPVAGDWNGDGTDTVGIFRKGAFFLASNNINGGEPVNAFGYGLAGDVPVVGDWNKDGTTEVGIYRTDPYRGAFFLASSNIPGGGAVNAFTYGQEDDIPVAGKWI